LRFTNQALIANGQGSCKAENKQEAQAMTTTPTNSFAKPLIQLAITAAITGLLISAAQSIGRSAGNDYQTPGWAIVIHLLTVIPALPLGAYVLLNKKGDARHRMLGKVWAMLMLTTAVVSFWIRDITGHIGPIHIFSVVTLISIPLGIWRIRRGDVAAHRRAMLGPYIGLIAAGLFALTPGRMLGGMIFG
jgi:uncharacterized membrane protein